MWAETRHRNIEKTRSMNNLITSKLKVTNNQGVILKMLFMDDDANFLFVVVVHDIAYDELLAYSQI